jgi:enamine deaminase RidA (YjgF/YER057c/UK114 family)
MRACGGLHLDYVSLAEYQTARWDDVLGVATFQGAPARSSGMDSSGIPVARINTPVLTDEPNMYEVWRCGEAAESGQQDRVSYRRTPDMLFGCITQPEPHGGRQPPLQEATLEAYRQICATLETEKYPHLLRVWNYLPDINRESHGTERYRQFNSARLHVLRASGRPITGGVPAASALGAPADSPLVVYFLAARTAPIFVENPRQMSAYHYPRQYGTHRPVFSRATLLRQSGSLSLFISGTASIVGHRSVHVGDIGAQTRETLTNIQALLAEANRAAPGAGFTLRSLACKVYVRRPVDLPIIQAHLNEALGQDARTIFLQADICRQDLLIEIEAAGIRPLAAAA